MLVTILEYLYVGIILLMTVQAIFNIRLLLYIWEEPQQAWLNSAPTIYREPRLSFTILLPAYHEEDVYAYTLQKVYDLNYPKKLVQVIALLREHDTGTIKVAQEKLNQLRAPNVQLLITSDKHGGKPHQLNLGLRMAKGDIVTIFDAEDEPHPDILQVINATFLTESPDVVQSGVQLMNHNTKWFCFLNVLEYFFWFKSALHFFARCGMTPLGGNTVFVKRELMQRLGGWDHTTLTEDADLGIRLCIAKARVRILYDDAFVTREIGETLAKDAGPLRLDPTRGASVLHDHDPHIDPDVLFRQDAGVDGNLDLYATLLPYLLGVYQPGRSA